MALRSSISMRRFIFLSAVFLPATLALACGPQAPDATDPASDIATLCLRRCGHDPELVVSCVRDLGRALTASSAGCMDEFEAYFACEQAQSGCWSLLDDGCRTVRFPALVACARASATWDPCRRAVAHLEECTGEPQGAFSPDFCDGIELCHALCLADLSCAEVLAVFEGKSPAYDLCRSVCPAPP